MQHTPGSTGKAEDAEAASGETKGPPPPSTLIDVIVETVSKCSDEADDGVQLQVCFSCESYLIFAPHHFVVYDSY